jgi:hypothetical protein
MYQTILPIAFAACASHAFAQVQTVSLTPAADTSLFQNSPLGDHVSNGTGAWLHVGLTNSWGERRPLLRFNLASRIPSNATITSVSLRVNVDRASGGGAVPLRVNVVPVLSSWTPGNVNSGGAEGTGGVAGEGDSTWFFRSYSATPANRVPWTPGGDLSSSNVSVATMTALGDYTFGASSSFIALVQGWVTNPQSNFGIALVPRTDQGGVARRIRSSESASSKPTLTVQYTLPPCDIDFNNDTLFPSDDDLIEFLNVLAGGTCSTEPPAGAGCDDIDINNDGLFPLDDDLVAFLNALAGAPC